MGLFIVIEGIDGSGKGTQAKLLMGHLRGLGRDPVLTGEPTRGPIGGIIRDHLADPYLDDRGLALLFAADRIEHLEKEVRPALESDRVVISDRYAYSSIAYQGQTIDVDWVAALNEYADRPDLVILLDIPPSLGRRRMMERGGDLEYFEEDEGFQEGVRKTYLDLSKGHHLPESLKTRWLIVDASKRRVEILDKIWDIVEGLL